jgi:translocator protein
MNDFSIREIPKWIVSIIIVYIAGAIGTLFTLKEITTWYVYLAKPGWAPPNWIVGPIWSTLYILIVTSLFLIWRKGLERKDVQVAILVFAVQLIINVIWSLVFFGSHSIFGGLIMVMLLWVAIIINIFVFYRISKPAGLLLIPYLVWVTIATYLQYYLFILNP